jgi:large subunit ribosomal protein L31
MKKDIHPEYYPDAKVICSCGNTFTVGSTQKVIRTDICSVCHPFFTGEQRLVDAGGQVERFIRRLEKSEELRGEELARQGTEGETEASE